MNKARRHPPAPEDLPELYLDVLARLEKLEGKVFQLLSEGTRDGLLRPTWRDVQEIRADIDQLREEIDPYDA
jgi:hypothetical protein